MWEILWSDGRCKYSDIKQEIGRGDTKYLGARPEKLSPVIKSLKEVKFKDFQYKVNNKILVTKSFLYRINKIDNNLCEYCHRQAETFYHLFIEGEKVKQFWWQLSTWLTKN